MPKKLIKKSTSILSAIGNGIRYFFLAIWKIIIHIFIGIKYVFIGIDRSAKTITLFIAAIGFLILALSASFYLFTSALGLKESPVFEEFRDKVAQIYVINADDDLEKLEDSINSNNQ